VTVKIQQGEWWRLFTAMFLHAGVLHLSANMVAVWMIGKSLEEDFGTLRITSIYILSGLCGNLLSANFLPLQITVGASGSCFGLLGAALGDLIQNSHRIDGCCTELVYLCFCATVSLGLGLFPLIDNFAHVGGFVAGTLLGTALLAEAPPSGEELSSCRMACRACLAGKAGILFGAFITLLVVLLATATDPRGWCSFCESINCVEAPWWNCDASSLIKCTGTSFQHNATTIIQCIDGVSCNVPWTPQVTQGACLSCCA